jgi:hypothetical protein
VACWGHSGGRVGRSDTRSQALGVSALTMWTYSQSTGTLYLDGVEVGSGYSGAGPGVNNPEMQAVANVGPIPEGTYTIGSAFTHSHTGPISMRLEPAGTNEMHGRSGFLVHGDNATHTASEGCIILPRPVREQIAASKDRQLEVTA